MANYPTERVSSEDFKSEYDPSTSLEGRYQELAVWRNGPLYRAREAAKLTIPSLLPPDGASDATKLYIPWQSIGSRGSNNLAAKLLLALLSPGFFRFKISQTLLDQLQQNERLKTAYEEGLVKYENEIMLEIESGTIRVSSYEALLHLIVAGNVLIYMPLKGGIKVYHLDSYVVSRDPMGEVLELIIQEKLSKRLLPPGIKDEVLRRCPADDTAKTINLYTCVRRDDDNRFETWQEVKGLEVPGSRGYVAADKCPWIALRWIKVDGSDYGRGHCEGLLGDLQSVEGLRQSVVEGSAAAAKVLFLVNPNGVTKQKTIAEAPNGAIRTGNAEDVSVVRVEKASDFSVAENSLENIKKDLEAAFLMNSSVTRNAERVTAEEIRFNAAELESALGGVYSLLAQEFQIPLIYRLIDQLQKQKRLKPLPKKIVRPTIVTGLEALSRGNDLQKLDVLVQGIERFGPEAVATHLSLSEYFARRAIALGINTKGLVHSAEQVQKNQDAAQQQALISQVVPHAAKSVGDIVKGNIQNGQKPSAQTA